MKTFYSFFTLELKRSLIKRNVVVMLLFLALAVVLTYTGIDQFEDIKKSKKEFQDIEKLKVQQWVTYTQYGGYGIYIYFIPSPLSIFFNNTNLFTELIVHVDTGERLNVFNSFKGKRIFGQKYGGYLDFSGIILLLGSLIALLYAYDGFRYKKYLKFLASIYGHRRAYLFTWFSRLIILCLYFIGVTLCVIVFITFFGIDLSSEVGHLSIIVLMMLLLVVFFFSMGTAITSLRFKSKGLAIIVIWFVFVFVLPVFLYKVVEEKSAASIDSTYKAELEKIEILMNFEQEVKKKKNLEETKKFADEFLKNGFKDMLGKDTALNKQAMSNISDYQNYAVIFPSTFFLSVNNGISSRGYENVIEFHRYAEKVKEEFMNFFNKKRGEEQKARQEKKGVRVESFFESGTKLKNIYEGKSRLPGNFGWGLGVTVAWVILITLFSYLVYKKSLFHLPKEAGELSDLDIDLEKGQSNAVLSGEKAEEFSELLYNVLSGKNRGFDGTVTYIYGNEENEKVDLVAENIKMDFIYLFQPEKDRIPGDIEVRHFISFIAGTLNLSREQLKELCKRLESERIEENDLIRELTEIKRRQVLLEVVRLKKSKICIFDNFFKGMTAASVEGLIPQLEELKTESAFLFLTNDAVLAPKIGDYVSFLKKDTASMSFTV